MNRNSASVSPCSTPVVILKKGVSPSGYITMERVFLLIINMVFTISVGIPYIIKILLRYLSSFQDLLNQKPLKSL